jgi:hypothetical protein
MSMILHCHFLPLADHVAGILHPLVLQLGHVDQALDAGLDLHEGTEVGDLGHLPVDLAADGKPLAQGLPGVLLQLLDAEAEALVLHVDVEHHRLDFVALLEQLARVLDALGPD